MNRILSLLLSALAVAMFVAGPVPAGDKARPADDKGIQKSEKKTHEGTLVSVKGNEFTMKHADPKEKEHTHVLAKNGKVIGEDGKECRLEDIKTGARIRVTTPEGDTRTALRVEVMKRKS
jgi:hypothetical protein